MDYNQLNLHYVNKNESHKSLHREVKIRLKCELIEMKAIDDFEDFSKNSEKSSNK